MSHLTFLQDLAIVMIVAGLVTILCHRFKQPVVLGYILAGVIIGPHTPPFPLIKNDGTIQTLSELGVIFLMFSLGLEFSLRKLRQVGSTALIAATLEILVMMGIGYGIGRLFHWSSMDSLFLGAIISISSTTIIMKALDELGLRGEKFAGMVFGILIVEDIMGIVLIAMLSGIARTGTLQSWDAVLTVGQLAVFLVVSLVLGLIAVPRLVGFVARFRSHEMLLVTVLGLCFGFCLLTVRLGFSLALGAFLIGAILAESKEIGKIEDLMSPIRDMFSAVFFVSVGLLIDPRLLVTYAWPIGVITLAVIIGQVVTVFLGTYLAGHDLRTSTRVGMSMSQIGEFSFIIAALGLSLKVTSGFLYPIAVCVSAVTTFVTPYLIRGSDPFTAWLQRRLPPTVLSYLNLYSRWLGQFERGRQDNQVRAILRRIFGQLAIFLGLIGGSILSAVFLSRILLRYFPAAHEWKGVLHSVLWLAAMLTAMPVYLSAYRKMKALGMILAELGITDAMGGERKAEVRAVVANTILAFGLLALAAYTFGLSYAVLPPRQVLYLLIAISALLMYWLRAPLNKIYFQGKAALAETFSKSLPADEPAAPAAPVSHLLREARLETLALAEGMPGAGRTPRTLELKTRTGAFIVGIEREALQIVNPEADEILLPGDQLLLVGSRDQLDAAIKVLAGAMAMADSATASSPLRVQAPLVDQAVPPEKSA
ncbi:MAG: sodium/proton antiporter [Fibrobacteres bacterium]|nr:sodium/proton antiporter [Fibrobacterota bacterium]